MRSAIERLSKHPRAQTERQGVADPVKPLRGGEAHRPHRSPLFPGPAAFLNDYVSMYVPKIFGLLVEAVLSMTLAIVKASM